MLRLQTGVTFSFPARCKKTERVFGNTLHEHRLERSRESANLGVICWHHVVNHGLTTPRIVRTLRSFCPPEARYSEIPS